MMTPKRTAELRRIIASWRSQGTMHQVDSIEMPSAAAELLAEVDRLVVCHRVAIAESAQRKRDADAHAARSAEIAVRLTEMERDRDDHAAAANLLRDKVDCAYADRDDLFSQLDEAHMAYAALRAELARTAADRDAATRILDALRAATSEVLLDADPESEPMLRLAQALQSALRFRSAAPAGERP